MQVPACLRRFSEEEINREVDLGRIVLTSEGYFYPRIFGGVAISATNKLAEKTAVSGTSYTTASLTPSAGKLYMLAVENRCGSGTAATPTATGGGGLTWVQEKTVQPSGNTLRRLTVFRAMKPSGLSSGTITVDFGGQTQTHVIISVDEFDNVDQTGTDGENAVFQSNTGAGSTGTSASVTLGAFGDATNNAAYMATYNQSSAAVTPESPYTELSDQQITSGLALEIEWNIGQDTSVTSSWSGSNNWCAIACEIKAPGVQAILIDSGSTRNGSSRVSASFTPHPDRFYMLAAITKGGTNDVPTVSTTTGLNFVAVDAVEYITGSGFIRTWRASKPSGLSTGTVTVSYGASQVRIFLYLIEITGQNSGGTDGSAALVQHPTNSGASGTGSISMSAWGDAVNNAGVAVWAHMNAQDVTPETGWTELVDLFPGDAAEAEACWRVGQDTSPTATWADTTANWGGVAWEILSSLASTGTPISGTDANGTTTETATETAAIPGTDANGTTTEATTEIVSLPRTDNGTASSEVITTRSAVLTDSGTSTEDATIRITVSDSGSGTEVATLAAQISGTDSGAGSQTSTETAQLSGTDSGTGTDAISSRALVAPDSGTDSEEISDRKATLTDTGTDSEVTTLAVAISSSDSGTASETATVSVPISGTDSGSGSEDQALTAILADADTGTGSESLADRQLAHTDAGTSVEVADLLAAISDTDTGTDSETEEKTVAIHGTDSGTATTEDAAITAASISDSDSGTADEVGVAGRRLVSSDAGTAAEVADIAAAISYIDSAHSIESADQVAALAASDNGTDSEIATPVSAVLSTADAGSFQDAGALHVYFPDTERGYGHDAGTLRAAYLSADSVTDSENGILHAAYSDTDAGTDDEFVEKAITDPDAGSISEVSALAAQISADETGAGADSIPTWAVSQEDSGTSSDAEIAKARYADQDYGTIEEFIGDRKLIVFDISTGTETWGETRDIPPGDLNVLIGVGRGQPTLVALKEITPRLVSAKTNGRPELISSVNGTRLIATAKQGPELERVG